MPNIIRPEKPVFYSEGLTKGVFQIMGFETKEVNPTWLLRNIITDSTKRVDNIKLGCVSLDHTDFNSGNKEYAEAFLIIENLVQEYEIEHFDPRKDFYMESSPDGPTISGLIYIQSA